VPNDAASGRARSEPGSTRPTRRPLLILGLVAGIVLLDQITKAWVVASLADGPLSIIGNTVEFRLSRNPGGAFSILTGFTPLLAVLAAIVAVVLVRVAQRARDPVMVVALSLVLGGALGNLVDRLFRAPGFLRGEVVDFVRVGAFPTFNVADSAVTIGAVLLLLTWMYYSMVVVLAGGELNAEIAKGTAEVAPQPKTEYDKQIAAAQSERAAQDRHEERKNEQKEVRSAAKREELAKE